MSALGVLSPDPARVRVKICGLTNEVDARDAISAGADLLGFNFFLGSKRYVDPVSAIPWIARLGGAVKVAVVVNPSQEELLAIRDSGAFDAIQFHGDESPEFCLEAAPLPWIRATRVDGPGALDVALAYDTPFHLIDSFVSGAYGGTGARLNWNLAADFVSGHPDLRVLLAGGLNPENAGLAASRVRPFALDVASGVESFKDPRKKNPAAVRAFIEGARAVSP